VAGGYFYLEWKQVANLKAWWLRLGIAVTAILIFVSLNNEIGIQNILRLSIPFAAGFYAPLFLILILLTALSTSQSSAYNFPVAKGLVLLGDASYALYIFQRPFHQLFEAYIFPSLGLSGEPAFYLYFFCLILFSIVLYLFFEKPVKRLFRGKSFGYKMVKPT